MYHGSNHMSYITLLIYPIILLILFIGSKVSKKSEFNEEWNSISETKAIQGIMALCIVCHHCAQQTCVEWLESGNIVHGLDFFSNTGFLFVSVFLFWSGYGLYKSLKNKPRYFNKFVKKRIFPIWLPYFISCFLYTFVRIYILKEKMIIPYLITNLTGITNGYTSAWFVQAIIVFYILFYVSFKHSRYDVDAIIYVWIGIVFWTILGLLVDHNDIFLCGQWWYNSALLFPIGISFAKYEDKILGVLKSTYKVLMPISVILSFLLFRLSRHMEITRGYYGQYLGLPFARKIIWRVVTYFPQAFAAIAFVLMTILVCMKIKFGNKALKFLGNHTLEIYLTHLFSLVPLGVRYNYIRDSFFYRKPWVLLAATLILTVPAAVLLKKVTSLVTKNH